MKWNDQKLIYNFLTKQSHGFTAAEIEKEIGRTGAHRRLSEMAKMGLAKKIGKRVCKITGKQAAIWFADDSPPKPQFKKPATHEIKVLRARIDFLEKENAKLRDQLERNYEAN